MKRKGGGVNPPPGKLEEIGLNGCWDDDFTKVLYHLSPEAGGIFEPRRLEGERSVFKLGGRTTGGETPTHHIRI